MNAERSSRERRAAVYAALGDPARLAVVDALLLGDRSPGELGEALGMPSNLLAHHLRLLEQAGVIERGRSEADRRRSYVRLVPSALPAPATPRLAAQRVVFVCTHNSARSQLASALWERRSSVPVASAGTHPARRVHRRAVTVGRRHGLRLDEARTAAVADVLRPDDLVVAVCDSAYEELGAAPGRLHWSVPDPVPVGTAAAFERAYREIEQRVDRLAGAVESS
jgi:protein-tyrosine-phosphatase/DNA-binding HxlR family transcriptional regulator